MYTVTDLLTAMTGSGRRGREESQYPVPRPKRSKGIPKYNDGQAHDQQCQVENNSECLEDQEGMILDLKSRVEMIDQHIRELKELIKEQAQQLQEVHHKLEATNQEQVEAVEPTAIQQLTPDIQSSPTLLGSEQKRPGTKLRLRWEKCRKAPECIAPVNVFLVSTDGSTCTCTCTHNQTAYFSASQSVYAYNSKMDKWIDLPDNPYYHFSLASINDKLTTIGGSVGLDRSNVTNSLLCLTGNGFSMKWSESFPPMPTKRCRTVIVYSSPSLIVAGGVNSDQDVYIIEVMNTDSLQWFTAGSLPHQYPLNSGMAYTMCRDRLYVLKCNYRTRSILTCLVTELLQSSQVVWKEFKAPVVGVAMVSLCEQLLAVGGIEADEEASAAIHAYDPETNTWELISRMPTARGCPLVAVLPSNRLMVVGGVEYKKDYLYDEKESCYVKNDGLFSSLCITEIATVTFV